MMRRIKIRCFEVNTLFKQGTARHFI